VAGEVCRSGSEWTEESTVPTTTSQSGYYLSPAGIELVSLFFTHALYLVQRLLGKKWKKLSLNLGLTLSIAFSSKVLYIILR
jgi:hypothetical protein